MFLIKFSSIYINFLGNNFLPELALTAGDSRSADFNGMLNLLQFGDQTTVDEGISHGC
jgi:hypothetical protein